MNLFVALVMINRVLQAICLSVEEVILRTAASLQTLSDFDDAPDVVDDAFLLVKTCLKYCPKALAKPTDWLLLWTCLFVGFMSSIVKLVALCLTLRVTCCMLGTRTWLTFLDKYCRRVEGALVRSLLAGALGALPSSRVSDITGVIAALLSCTHAHPVCVAWRGHQSHPRPRCLSKR